MAGYGTWDDSMGSVHSLAPKPPKSFDLLVLMLLVACGYRCSADIRRRIMSTDRTNRQTCPRRGRCLISGLLADFTFFSCLRESVHKHSLKRP